MTKAVRIKVVVWVCILVVVIAGAYTAVRKFDVLKSRTWTAPGLEIPIVSTRGHLENGKLVDGHGRHEYSTVGSIPGMTPGTEVPGDLLVIVHGFNNSPAKALYQFGLARDSLVQNGFDGAVVGFSWDADTQHDPWSMTGYHEGRRHAIHNGPKLAQFVADYKSRCPDTRVHIVGYSMSTRLALEVLLALDQDPALAESSWKVDSVHLVGAAVDNEEVEVGEKYGQAIENRAGVLINYYSEEDDVLGVLYPFKEYDRALGEADIEHPDRAPHNYRAIDAENELVSVDLEGNIDPSEFGDNHLGCLGIRSDDGELLSDGVMDLVAEYIRESANR